MRSNSIWVVIACSFAATTNTTIFLDLCMLKCAWYAVAARLGRQPSQCRCPQLWEGSLANLMGEFAMIGKMRLLTIRS